jgi:hypothetical protein
MMYHHSSTPYAIAAEQCSQEIRAKFERQIETGRNQAQHTISMLQKNQPKDNYIWHDDAVFDVDPETGIVRLHDKKKPEAKQFELAKANLNTRFHGLPPLEKTDRPRRFNARSINSQVRGLVSDAFARWNTARLVEAFVSAITKAGAVMIDAKYTELQFSLKAVWPSLFEPALGEVMLFGIGLKRSDFGLTPLSLEGVCDRPWCTNLATMESVYTKKNLSARYNDSDVFSQETMDAETEAHALAIGELVEKYLSEDFIGMQVNAVHKAANTEVKSIDEALAKLKGVITVKEAEVVKAYYESKEDKLLPVGNTEWRFSSALSLLAQQAEPDRGLELEQVAGKVAGLKAA